MEHYEYSGYKTQRIYMVRFETMQKVQKPKLYFPEIDARGFYRHEVMSRNPEEPDIRLGVDRGPVLGTTEGDIVFINLRRVRISNEAPLFVTSSNDKIMAAFPTRNPVQQMPSPIPDALENEEVQPLAIKGIKGSGGVEPNVAKVEIRYGSNKGPIVAEMTVYVFSRIDVFVAPHLVKISGVPPAKTDINELFKPVQAIWQPCGIRFVLRGPVPFDIESNVNMPGKWSDVLSDALTETYYNSAGISIYFVNGLVKHLAILEAMKAGKDPKSIDVSTKTVAYTFSPESRRRLKDKSLPLIVCSTENDEKETSFALAHEIGHYLGLPHTDDPYKKRSMPQLDFWSLNSLMRPGYSPDLVMPGYGHLILMKDLFDKNSYPSKAKEEFTETDWATANHVTDPEWATARKTARTVRY